MKKEIKKRDMKENSLDEIDLTNEIVCAPQSAGINSATVMCWLANLEKKPKDVYIFYSHLKEHSDDSMDFVLAVVEYSKKHFENVIFEYVENSIIDFFLQQKMIPHPKFAPCTFELKIKPANLFLSKHNCTIDMVGYIRTEKRRIENMNKKRELDLFLQKQFPISHLTDEDCFDIVKKEIGWYPKIYDYKWNDSGFIDFVNKRISYFDEYNQKIILKDLGKDKRVFNHNNCLPCKNMNIKQLLCVEYFFPEFHKKATELSIELNAHWGREQSSYVDAFMTTFGREDWEVEGGCKICEF